MVVDDAHWLDPASSALLLALVTRHHVRVLATVRAGTPAPDAVRALWKDAGLLRLDLEPLGQDATTDMAVRLLGAPVERGTQRWLWQTSAGNPLFLSELVRSGVERGALVLERGHWRRVAAVPPAERLLDLLDERIDALTAAERRAFALVALTEPASLELLARLDAFDSARSLESRGLLAGAPTAAGAGLRVGHPLYGEAVRASLRATEARALHRELAEQLDPAAAGNRLRLVSWALEDGQPVETSELSEGAEAALAAFDPELAIRLGRAAVDAGGGLDATLSLASALRAVGRFGEAEQHLRAVEAAARGGPRITTYLFLRVGNAWALGDSAQARALLARRDLARDSEAIAAALYSYEGRHREAVSSARKALAADTTDRLRSPRSQADMASLCSASRAPRWSCSTARSGSPRASSRNGRWPRSPCSPPSTPASSGPSAATVSTNPTPRLVPPATTLAAARATAGDVEGAREAWETGARLLGERPPNPLARTLVDRAAVLVCAGEGDPVRARALALDGARAAGEAIMVEGEMLHLHLRVGGDPKHVASRLEQIAAATQAPMAQLWARQATGARDHDAAALAAVASGYEQIGARIYAAEAAAQAAIAHAGTGNRDAARRQEARAARLAAGCGAGGLTLVATMRTSGLTAREQQITRLVALGLSNAQIAERLSLSVRTVESHVYRATTKLGVRDRTALAALLDTRRVTAGT
ncbi:MAG TPA: LuxR C-terminal-related transcriptional regulator [Solirubrobacteraceae bacterium]|nr:LuxR C-terminal-related transcriptional regulator [Solirubrobacteraceae bacterium]